MKKHFEICWNSFDPEYFAVGSLDLRFFSLEIPSEVESDYFSEKWGKRIEEDDLFSQKKKVTAQSVLHEVQGIKCMHWIGPTTPLGSGSVAPDPLKKNSEFESREGTVEGSLLAAGLNSGRTVVVQNKPQQQSQVVQEFMLKYMRPCNCLAWNPVYTHYLAAGYDKVRGDDSAFVWDLTRGGGAEKGGSTSLEAAFSVSSSSDLPLDLSGFSLSARTPTTSTSTPLFSTAPSEATVALSWMPSSPLCLVAGTGTKWLRIHDLRNINFSSSTYAPLSVRAHSKLVQGVSFDPFNDQRLLTFSEDGQVKVWDIRQLTEPTLILNTNSKTLSQVTWSPTHPRIIASLGKDEREIKTWNTDIIATANPTTNVNPTNANSNTSPNVNSTAARPTVTYELPETVSSFSWHPKNRYRMLAVSTSGTLHSIPLQHSIPLHWSPRGFSFAHDKALIVAQPKATTVEATDTFELNPVDESHPDPDISVLMRHRATKGYCMEPKQNQSIIAQDPDLLAVWTWIANFKDFNFKNLVVSEYQGIQTILKSQTKSKKIEFSESPLFFPFYSSPERAACLHMIGGGWGLDKLENTIKQLELDFQFERAAALAVFQLDLKRAIGCLQVGYSHNQEPHLLLAATALAGCDERSKKGSLWKENCSRLKAELRNPYLGACFAFLCSEPNQFSKVIEEINLPLQDRIALCCRFLNDEEIEKTISKMVEDSITTGNIQALLLTGLRQEAIKLAQAYINRTCDIQSVALIFSHVVPRRFQDKRIDSWVKHYREFLDQGKLWRERAKFDIARKDTTAPQVLTRCHYCPQLLGKTMISKSKQATAKTKLNLGTPLVQKQNINYCLSCRNPLPRCALCLNSFTLQVNSQTGQNTNHTIPFSDWWTWCQTCRHGGHSGHILQWFETHDECPVTDCNCQCKKLSN